MTDEEQADFLERAAQRHTELRFAATQIAASLSAGLAESACDRDDGTRFATHALICQCSVEMAEMLDEAFREKGWQ